jgi:hypothetical protein
MEKVLRKKKYFILFKYQNKKPLQIQTKKERVGGGGSSTYQTQLQRQKRREIKTREGR